VTEQEWLGCTDPEMVLRFLRRRTSERKSRLFACACCRRLGGLLYNHSCQRALKAAERYADQLIDEGELMVAARLAWKVARAWQVQASSEGDAHTHAAAAVCQAASPNPHGGDVSAAHAAAYAAVPFRSPRATGFETAWVTAYTAERIAQAALLREICGSPFHLGSADPAWLVWNDGALRTMAQSIYRDQAFDQMPILADALEDAGCIDVDMLNHCRGPGPHVLGCWGLDLLLGRE
jgi:hypothetical protein